jgi:hypothetical protein
MKVTESKIFHLILGCASLAVLVLGMLIVSSVFASPANLFWVWAILVICCAISLIEMVIYFLFGNTEISLMLCKWLNIFIAIILFVSNTMAFAFGAEDIFENFSTYWFSFMVIILTYALMIMMIVYFFFAIKDTKRSAQKEE